MGSKIVFTPTISKLCCEIMPSFAQRGKKCESSVKAQIGADGLRYGYICIKYPEVHKKMNSEGRKA